jgi:hypothetical protein
MVLGEAASGGAAEQIGHHRQLCADDLGRFDQCGALATRAPGDAGGLWKPRGMVTRFIVGSPS